MQPNLSSPFNLRERLRSKPDSHVSGVALAGVLLVALFLASMTSKYIYAPGLTVAFPEDAAAKADKPLELPVSPTILAGEKISSVLTVKSDSMFIYDGRIFDNLSSAFPPVKGGEKNRGILLVKIDRNASIQGLFDLRKFADDAGFSAIQIAGESPANLTDKSSQEE